MREMQLAEVREENVEFAPKRARERWGDVSNIQRACPRPVFSAKSLV